MSQKRTQKSKPTKRTSQEESSSKLSFFETSPSKKKKLSSDQLRSLSSQNRHLPIGELLSLPKLKNETILKGDSERTLGSKSVSIRGVLVDNRTGRMPMTEKGKKGNRFIYMSDCTGSVSIGINAESSGLMAYDLEEKDCVEDARLFFAAELSCMVSWVPTKTDSGKATFFANNATIAKVDNIIWNEKLRFMYPTSLVCQNLAQSQFASSHLFTTVAFSGKLENFVCNDNNALVLYIQDVVGYAVIEVSFSSSGTVFDLKDMMEYMNQKKMFKDKIYFWTGPLEMSALNGNAWMKCNAVELFVHPIPENEYADYGNSLLTRPLFDFLGLESTFEIPDTPESA